MKIFEKNQRLIRDADKNTIDLDTFMEDNCFYFCQMHNVYINRARTEINKLKVKTIDNLHVKEM